MSSVLSQLRVLLLAGITAGVFAGPRPVAAQQAPSSPPPAAAQASPAAAQTPTPPPSWMQGAPNSAEESHLAPQVSPPIPTAADKLPVAELKLPKNFHLEVFASGVLGHTDLSGNRALPYPPGREAVLYRRLPTTGSPLSSFNSESPVGRCTNTA